MLPDLAANHRTYGALIHTVFGSQYLLADTASGITSTDLAHGFRVELTARRAGAFASAFQSHVLKVGGLCVASDVGRVLADTVVTRVKRAWWAFGYRDAEFQGQPKSVSCGLPTVGRTGSVVERSVASDLVDSASPPPAFVGSTFVNVLPVAVSRCVGSRVRRVVPVRLVLVNVAEDLSVRRGRECYAALRAGTIKGHCLAPWYEVVSRPGLSPTASGHFHDRTRIKGGQTP